MDSHAPPPAREAGLRRTAVERRRAAPAIHRRQISLGDGNAIPATATEHGPDRLYPGQRSPLETAVPLHRQRRGLPRIGRTGMPAQDKGSLARAGPSLTACSSPAHSVRSFTTILVGDGLVSSCENQTGNCVRQAKTKAEIRRNGSPQACKPIRAQFKTNISETTGRTESPAPDVEATLGR